MDKLAKAEQTLLEKVYAPAFFNKLAEFGVVPQTEEEAAGLLELAAKTKVAGVEPQGSELGSIVKQANSSLDQLLGSDNSVQELQGQFDQDSEIKEALEALRNAGE